jgi:hypothetical protein
MMDTTVSVQVRESSFKELVDCIASLPVPFRPTYFTVGERIHNKEASRIEDATRFSTFVHDHVARVSGFDLVGERIRFSLYVGATRNRRHESTHVGCSAILRGQHWKTCDYLALLKELCSVPGVEEADACRREEWNHRHLSIKHLPQISVRQTLGADISAFLPGLYWWTVFSEELAARHHLDVTELAEFAERHERWRTAEGGNLYAFQLYESPDDWKREEARVSTFLESHPNFFSLTRLASRIESAQSEEALYDVVRPYRAGSTPWENSLRRH